MGRRSLNRRRAGMTLNMKLVSGSVALATLLVCGMVALLATAPSLTDMPIHHAGETDEMLKAAPLKAKPSPLFYHGSNGNGDTTAAAMADIAKIGMLFKEMKTKTGMYLENQTLIAYTKQEIKNKKLAKAIEKAFPDAIPKSQWKGIMEGASGSASGSGSR